MPSECASDCDPMARFAAGSLDTVIGPSDEQAIADGKITAHFIEQLEVQKSINQDLMSNIPGLDQDPLIWDVTGLLKRGLAPMKMELAAAKEEAKVAKETLNELQAVVDQQDSVVKALERRLARRTKKLEEYKSKVLAFQQLFNLNPPASAPSDISTE